MRGLVHEGCRHDRSPRASSFSTADMRNHRLREGVKRHSATRARSESNDEQCQDSLESRKHSNPCSIPRDQLLTAPFYCTEQSTRSTACEDEQLGITRDHRSTGYRQSSSSNLLPPLTFPSRMHPNPSSRSATCRGSKIKNQKRSRGRNSL